MYLIKGFSRASSGFGSDPPTGSGRARGSLHILYQQEIVERSWEQRFRDIQQELSHMNETVKGRAPVSMDALVQQTESPFMTGVLHFPLLGKFRMPQIETFDEMKDPINHLNTYKNQMKLH